MLEFGQVKVAFGQVKGRAQVDYCLKSGQVIVELGKATVERIDTVTVEFRLVFVMIEFCLTMVIFGLG